MSAIHADRRPKTLSSATSAFDEWFRSMGSMERPRSAREGGSYGAQGGAASPDFDDSDFGPDDFDALAQDRMGGRYPYGREVSDGELGWSGGGAGALHLWRRFLSEAKWAPTGWLIITIGRWAFLHLSH